MKRRLASLGLLLLMASTAHAMEVTLGGGGEHVIDRSVSCLTPAERADILAGIEANRQSLVERGLLPRARALAPQGFSPQHVALGWPLKLRVGNDPGYHGISNFVDEHPGNPGQLLDYNCGTRTYDQAGYNHQGTDFFTFPFGWYKMDHDEVEIVAAAPGVIVGKVDGNFDRSCGFGGGSWNAVYVQHGDGSTAWYGHMKNGSTTPKGVGQTVVEGEYLGIVGSSGNSTGPHLHFELYDATNALIDPWGGPCNSLGGTSWWADQRPYYDSAINALYTHVSPPMIPGCPTTETPNRQDTFTPGQTVYFAAYYHDQLAGQVTDYRVRDAAGALVDSWSHSSSTAHYAASGWYWVGPLPTVGFTLGAWSFEADFEGKTYAHEFFVVDPTAATASGPVRPELARVGSEPGSGRVELELRVPSAGPARLTIYDVAGRRVARLVDGWLPAGTRRVSWTPASAAPGGSGVYLASLECAAGRAGRKLVVLP